MRGQNGHRLANGGAGGDDVVHDQHPARERRADDRTTLAVVLSFLAIEAPRDITAVLFGQGHGDCRHQWNAFVGGPEQGIEFQSGGHDRGGVTATQASQGRAAVEQSGVEEVRANTPGFEGKFTEAQYAPADGEVEKFPLIVPHGSRFRCEKDECRYHSALHDPSDRRRLVPDHARHHLQRQWHPFRRQQGLFRLVGRTKRRCGLHSGNQGPGASVVARSLSSGRLPLPLSRRRTQRLQWRGVVRASPAG